MKQVLKSFAVGAGVALVAYFALTREVPAYYQPYPMDGPVMPAPEPVQPVPGLPAIVQPVPVPVAPVPLPPPACRLGVVSGINVWPAVGALAVRTGPGMEYWQVGVVYEGMTVEVCGRFGSWGRLPSGGWLSLNFVTPLD